MMIVDIVRSLPLSMLDALPVPALNAHCNLSQEIGFFKDQDQQPEPADPVYDGDSSLRFLKLSQLSWIISHIAIFGLGAIAVGLSLWLCPSIIGKRIGYKLAGDQIESGTTDGQYFQRVIILSNYKALNRIFHRLHCSTPLSGRTMLDTYCSSTLTESKISLIARGEAAPWTRPT